MEPDDFDLAGFAVGVVERGRRSSARTGCGRATCWSACPRRACAPTATRWPATCCSSGPALASAARPGAGAAALAGRRAARGRRSSTPRRCWRSAASSVLASTPCAHITGAGSSATCRGSLPARLRRRGRRGTLGRCPRSSPRSSGCGRGRRRRDGAGLQPRARHGPGGRRRRPSTRCSSAGRRAGRRGGRWSGEVRRRAPGRVRLRRERRPARTTRTDEPCASTCSRTRCGGATSCSSRADGAPGSSTPSRRSAGPRRWCSWPTACSRVIPEDATAIGGLTMGADPVALRHRRRWPPPAGGC